MGKKIMTRKNEHTYDWIVLIVNRQAARITQLFVRIELTHIIIFVRLFIHIDGFCFCIYKNVNEGKWSNSINIIDVQIQKWAKFFSRV